MNPNIVPISSEKHRALKATTSINIEALKHQHVVAITVHEIAAASIEFPVFIIKNQKTGEFQLVAMTGLEPQTNLFVEDDSWKATYTPQCLVNYPFSLMYSDEKKQNFLVCIDENSYLLNETGHAIFNENGEQTDFLKNVTESLVRYSENTQYTKSLLDFLAKNNLLIEQTITLEIKEEKRNINGVYVINEEKLNSMPIEEFDKLRHRGLLLPIYAHLISIRKIQHLLLKLTRN